MKENLVNKLLRFSDEENLINKGDKIVVGVSGGMDSVCLLHLLHEIRERMELSLYVLHVHHGIRGAEADEDAAMVKNMADRMGLPFCLVRKNVKKLARENGLTEEEAGRNARYEAFENCRLEVGADKIAVAHHEEDQAETVLFHLFRGTGPRGICGIPAKRGCIIRPLLPVSRQEIKEYIEENKIDYVVDVTNLVPDYTRNKIRLKLLPFVQSEINGQAVQHIAEASEKNRHWKEYIEKQGKKAFVRITENRDGNIYISVDAFLQEDPVIQDEILRQVFSEFVVGAKDIGQIHYRQAEQIFRGNSGRRFHFPGNLAAVKEYGFVCFGTPALQENKEICEVCQIPSVHIVNEGAEQFRISFRLEKRADLPVEIPQKDYTKWFDYDMIKDGLVLRNPKEGDYFILNEKGDRKKLSRYYIDVKIPAGQRAEQIVLAEGSHVVWALPGRISEMYKVSEHTKTVLVVTKERDIHERRDQNIN